MKKYYLAYDERYKQIHSKGFLWEKTENSGIVFSTIKKYNITPKNNILDLGVGEGRDSIFLLKQGYNVTGVDCSAEAIKTCENLALENKIENFDFRVVDIVKGGMENEYFDFIYSIAVLHMLCTEEDRKGFYQFINTHLKENGIALISILGDETSELVTDYQNAFDNRTRYHSETDSYVVVANTSFKMVSKQTFFDEIKSNGFNILEYKLCEDIPNFNQMMTVIISK